jgi:hypothetical protein
VVSLPLSFLLENSEDVTTKGGSLLATFFPHSAERPINAACELLSGYPILGWH